MYYSAPSNFDSFGSPLTPSGLESYNRIQSDLLLKIGLMNKISVFGRLSWAYVNQNSTVRPGNAFGLADQSIGLNFRILGSPQTLPSENRTSAIDLQTQVDFPAYSNSVSTTRGTPSMGDSTLDFTGGLFAQIPLYSSPTSAFKAVIGGGYTYRSDKFSAALPWSTQLQFFPYRNGFFGSVAGLGLVSLRNYSRGPLDPVQTSVGSGGSYFTGDINSSLIQVRGQLGYKVSEQTEISASMVKSVWGQSAPNGLTFILGFQMHLGNDKIMSPFEMSPQSYGSANRGFLNYSLETKILKSNDRMNLVKIAKGSQDGIAVGQIFDIFLVNKEGITEEAMARARVTNVRANDSALVVEEYFKEISIEEGFIARRLIE